MEPRRPKHKQQPALVVSPPELERALSDPSSYLFQQEENADAFTQALCSMQSSNSCNGTTASFPVVQTHMSMVALVPRWVFKIKKSKHFGTADFSTLYKRFQTCMAEVQLNQRLAPNVYFGVVPISMHRETRRVVIRADDYWTSEKNTNLDYWFSETFGDIVEWSVHMLRLPEERTLLKLLEQDRLTSALVAGVAAHLVDFHQHARRGPMIEPCGKEEVIRRNVEESFRQTKDHVGVCVTAEVYQRVEQLSVARMAQLREVFENRVRNGYICDGHGDLRLEHVYFFQPTPTLSSSSPSIPQKAKSKSGSPIQFIIPDCIEFNDKLRFADPISDAALLMMDMWKWGRPDLARRFMNQYLLEAVQNDPENEQLFLFYGAYRAIAQAKKAGWRVLDGSLPSVYRDQQAKRARGFWLLALTMLSNFADRPCLVLVGGLPASGKSNLASMVVQGEAGNGMHWIRSDSVRKEVGGLQAQDEINPWRDEARCTHEEEKAVDLSSISPVQVAPAPVAAISCTVFPAGMGSHEEGLYSPEITKRTYEEICTRASALLREGKRVVVDATFRKAAHQEKLRQLAIEEGALWGFVFCVCDREIIKGRLLARQTSRRYEVSGVTWQIFEAMEKEWEMPDCARRSDCFVVNTEKEKELTLRITSGFLRKLELL